MEQREIFEIKFNTYQKAVKGFGQSLEINVSGFDDIVRDTIKNGDIYHMG